MQKQITWKALADNTIEHCTIQRSDQLVLVNGHITGVADELNVEVKYSLTLDTNWTARVMHVEGVVENSHFTYDFHSDGKGNWFDAAGGIVADHCIDVDITLTPFTNSLPINRLTWKLDEPVNLTMLYVDVLNRKVYADKQVYTKLDDHHFLFENDEGKFKAKLLTNGEGFVTHYPDLFKMS